MQTGKKTLRPLREDESKAIREFFRGLGLSLEAAGIRFEQLRLLELPNASYHDVFEVPEWYEELSPVTLNVYSAGDYLGLLARARSGYIFKPGLPLAHRLAGLCNTSIKCHVVDERGEKVFLYGKPVDLSHVISLGRGVTVVINRVGEALGWGRLKAIKGKMVLEPLADLGWYLRRGG